jgi:hypothetical protein
MFKTLGFGDLSSIEIWTVSLVAVALSLIVGWVLDLIAEHIGFGIFGNALICMLALAMSLIAFRHYVGDPTVARLHMVMAFGTASVVLHMAVLITARRLLKL